MIVKQKTLYEHLKAEREWLRARLSYVHGLIADMEREVRTNATTITPAPVVQARTTSSQVETDGQCRTDVELLVSK